MLSSWIPSWLAGPRVQLADDDVEAAIVSDKAPATSHHADARLKNDTCLSRNVVASLPTRVPPAPLKPSKEPLLDRYAHLLDLDAAFSSITLSPTPEDGHWLLAPPGSMRFWAWTSLKVSVLLARLGVCWVVLSVVELLV